MADTQLFINGEWVDAQDGATFDTYAPSTGEKIAAVAKGGRDDAQKAVQAARNAFDNGPWRKMSGKERADAMRKIREELKGAVNNLVVGAASNALRASRASSIACSPS